MTSRLDPGSIASLVRPTGWNDLTRGIFTARYLHTLVGIRRLATTIPDAVSAEAGFDSAIQAIMEAPSTAQQRVLRHPSAAFWVDVAWGLVARRAHARFPEVHLIPHLSRFWNFAFAAVAVAGQGRLSAEVRADGSGNLALPGSGMVLSGFSPWEKRRLEYTDGTFSDVAKPWCPPRLLGGLSLDWLDENLRLGGRTDFDFADLSAAEAAGWRNELDDLLGVIAAASPLLFDELSRGLQVIVPVRSPDASLHVSGSFREAPGLVALALGGRLATAEALVHEYGHQKLNALLPLDPIVLDQGEAVHYSPWRDDPRPMTGVLHAVYSFATVIDFYRSLLAAPRTGGLDRDEIVERTYQVVQQVENGLAELRAHAELTPLGTSFITALAGHMERCAAGFPSPPAVAMRRIDARLTGHRERWHALHPNCGPAERGTAAPTQDPATAATLRALGLPDDWHLGSIVRRWYPGDSLLEAVRVAHRVGGVVLEPDCSSLTTELAAAHLAYVRDDFPAAARHYAACVARDAKSPYFWQCYAFALRHLGRHEEALYILTHTKALMERAVPPRPETDVRDTPRAQSWGLSLSAAAPSASRPVVLPAEAAVKAELRASPYWDFVAATLAGVQLPTLIAVAHGLKPTMDAWIPADGWSAFLSLTEKFGLLYHVDACFDRRSPQIAQVPPDQLTTTRAAFVAELRAGTEAHVFIARDPAALERVVGAGWYPLIVDGYVVNKHRADHDKFGDALGYPTCCQEFFRDRNNWNEDNTYYAAFKNTDGAPSTLCNPFLRHTIHGLVPYMPCSYSCAETLKFAGALREIIRGELPAYAAAIDKAAAAPVLCVSELRMYGFGNPTLSGQTISYETVESLYPIEFTDPLAEILASGNSCTLDEDLLHVHRGTSPVATYRTRGDRHGPECPFLITFA